MSYVYCINIVAVIGGVVLECISKNRFHQALGVSAVSLTAILVKRVTLFHFKLLESRLWNHWLICWLYNTVRWIRKVIRIILEIILEVKPFLPAPHQISIVISHLRILFQKLSDVSQATIA